MAEENLAGDMTETMLKALRADRVAKVISRVTGKPCNCTQRKMRLNALHRKLREAKARREQRNKDKTG